jgi:aminoglycoside phosphotransferase (APT) family kinase protein
VEIANERLPDDQLGPQIAAGRDTAIHALGDDRVVRRAPDDRSFTVEAQLMEHVRAAGYPVPVVHRVGPGEMVLDRIPGPTMLEDLGRRPWRMGAHARLLADLHVRLHRIEAPGWLPPFPVEGERAFPAEGAVLHLDLHPANVILGPDGPVVIDWTNGARGAAAADLALTWIILAVFESDDRGVMKLIIATLRKVFLRRFLAAAGREDAAAALPMVAAYREQDRNIRPAELAALRELVAEVERG